LKKELIHGAPGPRRLSPEQFETITHHQIEKISTTAAAAA